MKGKYLLNQKLNLLNFTMGALLKIYTCIFVQFLSNFSCGKTVWMRLKASPALKGLITFAVINQTSPNLQGSCRNNSQCCLQNYMENGWELTSELTSKWITFNNSQSNFTPSSLITSAIIDRTSPNLHGSCHNTSRWCLQNYIENGWELTSELTAKWITFNKTQSNFTPISLITSAIINHTSPNLP